MSAYRYDDDESQKYGKYIMPLQQLPVFLNKQNILLVKCKDAPASSKTKFTKCQKEEICAKCKTLNKLFEDKPARRAHSANSIYKENRRLGNNKCRTLNRHAKKGSPANLGFHKGISKDCEKKLLSEAEKTNYTSVSADHVREIQLCGHPTKHENLKWMSRRANSWIGTTLKKFKTSGSDKHHGVQADCC